MSAIQTLRLTDTAGHHRQDGPDAIAYSAGCQARIDGIPLASCPYGCITPELQRAWRKGWREAHRNYASELAGMSWYTGWPVMRLPAAEDEST